MYKTVRMGDGETGENNEKRRARDRSRLISFKLNYKSNARDVV